MLTSASCQLPTHLFSHSSSLNIFPPLHPPTISQAQHHSSTLDSYTSYSALGSERMGSRGLCSVHNSSSLLFLPPHNFPSSSVNLFMGFPGSSDLSFPNPGAELLLTSVFPCSTLMCSSIFCFLNCLSTEVLDRLRCGCGRPVVEPAGAGTVWHQYAPGLL